MGGGETFIGRICGMFLHGRELLGFLFCLDRQVNQFVKWLKWLKEMDLLTCLHLHGIGSST